MKIVEEFEKELGAYAKSKPALDVGFTGLQALYETCLDQPPAILNSSVCDSAIRLKESFFLKLYEQSKIETKLRDPEFYKIQYDYWMLRNKTMADNICEAARTSPNKKIAVITGVDHHYLLLELLEKCEYASVVKWGPR